MKSLLAKAGTAVLGASLLLVVAPGAHMTTDSTHKAPDAAVVAEAHAAFIKYMSSHANVISGGKWLSPGAEHGQLGDAASGTLTSLPSVNWSGYADVQPTSSTQTFNYVGGHWTIPAVTCPPAPYQNQDAFIANWVGIDGATNGTVEQLGTGAQCFEGITFYYVWYEMFPNGTVQEGTLACINDNVDCPQPGDQISAYVRVTPGSSGENNYTLSLTDYTTAGNNFTVTQSCGTTTCLDQSAEWIIERPAFELPFGFQILPLVDFGRTGFTDGLVGFGGRYSNILGFNGPVYDVTLTDDSGSYYLDCVGQRAPVGTLLFTTPNQCPTAAPFGGSNFFATWDSSF